MAAAATPQRPSVDEALRRVAAGSVVQLYDDFGKCKRNRQKVWINTQTREVKWASEKNAATGKLSLAELHSVHPEAGLSELGAARKQLSLTIGGANVVSRTGKQRASQRLNIVMEDALAKQMWIVACRSLLGLEDHSSGQQHQPALDGSETHLSAMADASQSNPADGEQYAAGATPQWPGRGPDASAQSTDGYWPEMDASAAGGSQSPPPVFGVPLGLIDREMSARSPHVPHVIAGLMQWLSDLQDVSLDIFQQSGDLSAVEALSQLIDYTDDIFPHLETASPAVVASVLKTWLRELPEPLLTHMLFDEIIDAANFDRHACQEILTSCVARLPLAHFEVLHALVQFLVKVADRPGATAKDVFGVATVFMPLVLYSESELVQHARADADVRAKVFTLVMEEQESIFSSRLSHPVRLNRDVWAAESAVTYLNFVKDAFGDGHPAAKEFVSIMGSFQDDRSNTMTLKSPHALRMLLPLLI